MGCCNGKDFTQKNINHRLFSSIPNTFTAKNFVFIDYTNCTEHCKSIHEIAVLFAQCSLTSVQVYRENGFEHSSLLIESVLDSKPIGLIVQYTEKGFYLSALGSKCFPESSEIVIENVYLPPVEKAREVNFSEIILWVGEHKDEAYMRPNALPELNMGSRVFRGIEKLFDGLDHFS